MRDSKNHLASALAFAVGLAAAQGGPLDYHLDERPGSPNTKAKRSKSSHKQNARKNRKARK